MADNESLGAAKKATMILMYSGTRRSCFPVMIPNGVKAAQPTLPTVKCSAKRTTEQRETDENNPRGLPIAPGIIFCFQFITKGRHPTMSIAFLRETHIVLHDIKNCKYFF